MKKVPDFKIVWFCRRCLNFFSKCPASGKCPRCGATLEEMELRKLAEIIVETIYPTGGHPERKPLIKLLCKKCPEFLECDEHGCYFCELEDLERCRPNCQIVTFFKRRLLT